MAASFFLMTPTKNQSGIGLPVHGTHAYPQSVLRPFLGVFVNRESWIVSAAVPHACRVVGCARMRAHTRVLWSRVAHRAILLRTARLALGRFLPSELAAHATRLVPALRVCRVRAMTR